MPRHTRPTRAQLNNLRFENPLFIFKELSRRSSRPWTTRRIAEYVGYSGRSAIESFYRYESIPEPVRLARIARLIGWTPGDLLNHILDVRTRVYGSEAVA